jgi:hypothetical protein
MSSSSKKVLGWISLVTGAGSAGVGIYFLTRKHISNYVHMEVRLTKVVSCDPNNPPCQYILSPKVGRSWSAGDSNDKSFSSKKVYREGQIINVWYNAQTNDILDEMPSSSSGGVDKNISIALVVVGIILFLLGLFLLLKR